MKIALLSGAVKNAGDYLITDRCFKILLSVYPDAEIKTYIRNEELSQQQIVEINTCDCIVIGGGPCYKWDLYPDSIPLVSDLRVIKPKIFMMGCGWYGDTNSPGEVWNYKFSGSSRLLLDRVAYDSKCFGCRDYYAVRVLQANGYKNSLMTGCPAWYDLEKLHERLSPHRQIRTIGISDPVDLKHFGSQSLSICNYLRKRYPEAEIHYLFHRGMKADQYTSKETALAIERMASELTALSINIHDISYSSDGFSIYNSCDMHVGHRVHAHIYNLSQRNISVLVEEDSRGAGVNEALGLWSIKAYTRKKERTSSILAKAYNKVFDYTTANPYVTNDLEAYLNNLEISDYLIMNQAFAHMESYYANMYEYTRSIGNILEES